ncbi:MAG: YraN family protein [Proteobacteria bacterium]|nr:MAG: YraN family protein [Pseudomonadota bacterium]
MNPCGAQAEDLALAFLLKQGLKLRARNYACRLGEIDLVLQEGGTLVFVEVRMRRSSAFGGAAESLTGRKRARLLAAARHYLSQQATLPDCRFDAVLIDGDGPPAWIKNAFGE